MTQRLHDSKERGKTFLPSPREKKQKTPGMAEWGNPGFFLLRMENHSPHTTRLHTYTMHWKDFREIPVSHLALRLSAHGGDEASHLLRQVEGWQRLRTKVPSWAAVEDLEYPPRLSLEQCSGEDAARYKAKVARELFEKYGNDGHDRLTMADLTGGLGVDFSMLSPLFQQSAYVERSEELCRLAHHNFPLLGLKNAEIVCADGEAHLRKMERTSLIFLDPARRDTAGRKTVRIADCQPDVGEFLPLLLEKGRFVMLKLSPMLDISEATRTLGECVRQVHITSHGGECKELLFILAGEKDLARAGDMEIIVREGDISFHFTAEQEKSARVEIAPQIGKFLYEPGPATLKAGAFRTVAEKFRLQKLHPNTHLYTSGQMIEIFPGRTFKVLRTFSFNKTDLRTLRMETGGRANLTVRNFPVSVAGLRRKLRLAEGGTAYLFATTMCDGRHLLILCEKT